MTKEALITKVKLFITVLAVKCHKPDGSGMLAFPALKGGKIATGPIENHIDIVVHGNQALLCKHLVVN